MPRPAGTSTLPLVTPLSAPLAPTLAGGSSAPCFKDVGSITTVVCGGRELQLLTRSPIAFCRCSRALFPSSEVSSPPPSPAAIFVTRAPLISFSPAGRSNTACSGGVKVGAAGVTIAGAGGIGLAAGTSGATGAPIPTSVGSAPLKGVELGMGGV